MEEHTSLNCLYKPIAVPAVSPANCVNISSNINTNYPTSLNDFIAIAGSDINQSSQVYLLYEMSTDLLARRFVINETRCSEKLKLLVSSCWTLGSALIREFYLFF